MNQDQLNKRKNQQLKKAKDKLYNTLYARDIDVYKPQVLDGKNVLADEDDFEEPDVVGTLKSEEMPLSYGFLDTSKAVEVTLNEEGGLNYVRSGEVNEYAPDKAHKFLVQDPDIPLQTVIQFEIPTSLTTEAMQTITLIKVDSQPIGKPPFVDNIHIFASFHGDLS